MTLIDGGGSRVHLPLRLGWVRRRWLARSAGALIDARSVAGLAADCASG